MTPMNTSPKTSDLRDCSPQIREELISDRGSPTTNPTLRNREIVKKGIERLKNQILQLIVVFIS